MKKYKQISITIAIILLLLSSEGYGGVIWTASKRLTDQGGFPAIAVDGSNINMVWDNLYFKRSIDGGVTWKTSQQISKNASYSAHPAIAVAGSNIYVVWQDLTRWRDGTSNDEIYFKRSIDRGTTWSSTKRLTNNFGESYNSAIAVAGQNIYVVWEDTTPSGPVHTEIFFKRSADGGVTWKTSERLTSHAGYCLFPVVGAAGKNIYVIWWDDTPGLFGIYFKKGILN